MQRRLRYRMDLNRFNQSIQLTLNIVLLGLMPRKRHLLAFHVQILLVLFEYLDWHLWLFAGTTNYNICLYP